MARRSDSAFLFVFSGALEATGLWILSRPFLELPTRTPPDRLHLHGFSQFLFACGPLLAGLTLGLAAWRVHKGGRLGADQVTRWEVICFLAGVAGLIAGVLMGVLMGVRV